MSKQSHPVTKDEIEYVSQSNRKKKRQRNPHVTHDEHGNVMIEETFIGVLSGGKHPELRGNMKGRSFARGDEDDALEPKSDNIARFRSEQYARLRLRVAKKTYKYMKDDKVVEVNAVFKIRVIKPETYTESPVG